MNKVWLYILLLFVIFPSLLLLMIFATGRVRRAYPVLGSNAQIDVKGQKYTPAELAQEYHPIMYKNQNASTPPLLWLWYNIVDAGDNLVIIYYNVWENEINPNPLVHRYYSFFRAFYYGYPLYDIEYIQVTISKTTGNMERIMFETGPSNDFYSLVNQHLVLNATPEGLGSYLVRITDRATGAELRTFEDRLLFKDSHAKLGVQTWNHLSVPILPDNEATYPVEISYPAIKYLSEDDYTKFKFVRKSQGDYLTHENRISLLISAMAIFVFVSLPAFLLSRGKIRR